MAIRIRPLKNQLPDVFEADEKHIHRLQGKAPYVSLPFWAGVLTLVLAYVAEPWLSPGGLLLSELLAVGLCLLGLASFIRESTVRTLVVTNKRVLLLQNTGGPFCALKEELRLVDAQPARVGILTISPGSLPLSLRRCVYVQLRVQFNTGTYRVSFVSFNPPDRSGRSSPTLRSVFEVAETLSAVHVPPSIIDHLDRLVAIRPDGD